MYQHHGSQTIDVKAQMKENVADVIELKEVRSVIGNLVKKKKRECESDYVKSNSGPAELWSEHASEGTND
jgi:hypothetical protein